MYREIWPRLSAGLGVMSNMWVLRSHRSLLPQERPRLLADSDELQDESRIVLKGCPSMGSGRKRSRRIIRRKFLSVSVLLLLAQRARQPFRADARPLDSIIGTWQSRVIPKHTREIQYHYSPLDQLLLSPPRELAAFLSHIQDRLGISPGFHLLHVHVLHLSPRKEHVQRVSRGLARGPWRPRAISHRHYRHDPRSHPHSIFLNHSRRYQRASLVARRVY